MIVTVLIDFSSYSDSGLIVEAQGITGKMKVNTYFPPPNPALDAVVLALAGFITALADCTGDPRFTSIKNAKRVTLLSALRTLGLYVQVNCNNDLSIVQTTGFKTRKEREAKGVLPAPGGLKIEVGPYPGSIKVSVDKVKGANTYLYVWKELPATDNTKWEFDLGKKSFIIKNLTQGKEYAFKVAAKGSADEMIFTNVENHFVA